ncbi:alpha/beta hydrolase [Nonomuraea sp. NPDC059194]|uniref:alpha/beta hydrolase n=1 Tax=Nonomuraea sp. NPDC059194 TaxID=3346764 RepID=UPI0036D1646F
MTSPRGRGGFGLLTAGAVLLGLAAAGCATGKTDARPPSVPADAGALRGFYEQRIAWKACEDGFECGRLEVPLDYADPGGDTITLAVTRKPAADQRQRIGSLLLNPGGPGGSGVDFARGSGEALTDRLRARYDIVGFDPRGVGKSAAIRCAPDAAAAYGRQVRNPRARGEPSASERADELKKLGAGCLARSGELLAHVSTAEAAKDMDVLRGVLGDARLHYLGFSYGTMLGAVYAELFPGRVGRLVLDSAVDPRVWPTGASSIIRARGFEVALDSFLADCATRSDCALGTDPKEARRRLVGLLERIDRRPLPGEGPQTVDKETAVALISGALYDKSAWPLLRTAFQQAMSGKGAALLELGDSPSGTDDNSGEAMLSIVCLDGPPALTSAHQVEARLPAFRKAAPVFGERVAWEQLSCAYWPVKPTGRPHAITARGAAPILVVGNLRDPATPYAWSKALAGQLSSGVLLTHDGDGHGAYDKRGNACVKDAVDTYLIDGRPPADGARCG